MLFILLANLFWTLTPLCIMQLFEAAVSFDVKRLLWFLFLDFLLFMLYVLFGYCRDLNLYGAVREMNTALRARISESLLGRDYQSFDEADTGTYLSWYSNDLHQLEQQGFLPFYQLLDAVVRTLFSAVALFYLHWMFGLSALVLGVLLCLAPRLFNGRIERKSAVFSGQQERFTGELKDLLSGMFVLKSFGASDRFLRLMKQSNKAYEDTKYESAKTRADGNALLTVLNILCQILNNLMIFGFAVLGLVPMRYIMGSGNYCSAVYNGLADISQLRLTLMSAEPFYGKLPKPDEVTAHPAHTAVLPPLTKGISVSQLSYSYGEKTVLKDADFFFAAGRKYALTGPSGCGKTTLIKILLGYLRDYTGTLLFDGTDARAISTEQIFSEAAYIPQEVYLFNTTVLDNITLGKTFTENEIESAVRESALSEDLSRMPEGLLTKVGEEGRNLSGGQRQRVAIARALIHKKTLLFVDEGTSALDKENADRIETALLGKEGLTLILISHHLSAKRRALFDGIYELAPKKA